MKKYLKKAFQLSDTGVNGLIKAILSFFLYYVSFIPPMVCIFIFADQLMKGNTGKPLFFLLFMLLATLVMYLIINYNYKTTYDETYQESANLRIDLAEQLSKLPLSYFSKHNLSDLAQTIMSDVASIEHAFANAVANSIGFSIYFLAVNVSLLLMNWKLGLCILLPSLGSALVLFITKKLQIRDVNKHYDKLRDISESFQNAIELNQEIKSYGLKEKVESQIDQQLVESENLQWKAQITQTIPVTIGQTLSILPIGITTAVGLFLLSSEQVSILILLGYIIMAAKLSGAMGGVLLYLTEIFYLDARISRISEIKKHELQGGEQTVLTEFDVKVNDVSFSYEKDTQVIHHASFTAEQGQVTALVGPSGCGKTTMLKLISRLYDTDSGVIQIGGTEIQKIHTDSMFKYVSIVFQDVVLFNTSIMENIRLGNLKASDEEVLQVSKLAGCDKFINKLPEGYQTIIGENGAKLSGGERQRLSIARAILKNAPIIILDEIAASLDVETEVQIQDGLNHLIHNKTVIVISHRMKSIENADKIVVMKSGTVESCGKHAQLLKQSPTYRNMIEKSNLTENFNY